MQVGAGPNLLLLHGGLTSVEAWFSQLPTLSKHFTVIALDMRGHGRSTFNDDEFTYRLLANDVVKVLDQMSIVDIHVVGWSDGGNVGLRLAVDHPTRITSLVAISANYHPDGLTDFAQQGLASATPYNHAFFARLLHFFIPKTPSNWSHLWEQVTTMWSRYPKLTADDLRSITIPTLLIQGQHDMISKKHILEMHNLIKNSQLSIVPATSHNLIQESPKAVNQQIIEFINRRIESGPEPSEK